MHLFVRTITWPTALILVVSIQCAFSQESSIPAAERFKGLADVAKLPGYVALQASAGSTTEIWYGGFLKSGGEEAFTAETVQPHGALNPWIVSIAVMKAVEQQHFTLDTPVNQLLPFKLEPPAHRNTPMTVRHLLAHTSGIKDQASLAFRSYLFTKDINYNDQALSSDEKRMLRRANLNARYSLRTLLEKSLTTKGDFYSKELFSGGLPGDTQTFSLTGLSLLALVIETSTGYFFDQYVSEYLFDPLGLTTATWTIPATGIPSAAPHMGSTMTAIPEYNQILYPSSGFRSSIGDVQKLLREVVDGYNGRGTLLKEESWKTLFHVLVPNFQNSTVPEMNKAPIEALSSYTMADYFVGGAQNYGSTSVVLIEPKRGDVVYFATNTCFAHLDRGSFFLSEIMRLLVEPQP